MRNFNSSVDPKASSRKKRAFEKVKNSLKQINNGVKSRQLKFERSFKMW